MTRALLIHHDKVPIPNYRVQNYSYLRSYLVQHGYDLDVRADSRGVHSPEGFPLELEKMGFWSLVQTLRRVNPAVCVLVINHSQPYFFPLLIHLRSRGIEVVSWTHGTDLQRSSRLSNLVHHVEHELCDGIVLYAESMRAHLLERHRKKAFVANNTLNLTEYPRRELDRARVLSKRGIHTTKNIIFVGRVQARKRIQDLLDAFGRLEQEDCGLIIVGPDEERILEGAAKTRPRVFPLGPLYGSEVLDLMMCTDVYCMPGAIGLSIVDAMYCGLPVVTEQVTHGPEIMYLREGENGFIVPVGDIAALAGRLSLLLTDGVLRQRFSERARHEIATRGHIDELCKGVRDCLDYVTSTSRMSPLR